jgi:undecaprenyl-diphosphatase
MTTLQISLLALIQGITEFLPISSSGHLILVPMVTGWPDQDLLLDVAVHVGTLGAVVGYFSRDIGLILRGLARDWNGGLVTEPGRRLLAQLALASVPVVLAGALLAAAGGAGLLRSVAVIGWASLIFGLLLYAADRWAPRRRRIEGMTFGSALLIGLAQVAALIPGTSRAGVTMTAARVLGFERPDAAHFSMLLAIPTILAAGTLMAVHIYRLGEAALGADALLGAALAFVSAWIAIALLMRWLRHASFTPFVIYRCVLGLLLLLYAYGG